MKTLSIAIALLSANILFSDSSTSNAQQATQLAPPQVKKVGFRMADWKTIHRDESQATQDLVHSLEEMGCEVQQNDHGGHIDIRFRCPSWKTVEVTDEEHSQQWRNWLIDNQFETVVLNPAPNAKLPLVKARMANWKTLHVDSSEQAQSLKETFELIGCEVTLDNHGNHIDAKIRCVDWITIGLATDQAAHVWQDWLIDSGFETQHAH